MDVLWTLLYAVGALTVLRFVYVAVRAIYKYFLRPPASLKRFLKDNAWAVVTGASDGIGKSFAFELAKRGFNVCLISRTKSKLEEVAKEISAKHKVKTEILPVDYSSKDPAIYDDIKQLVDRLDNIGILVNNVGINYSYPTKFLDSTAEINDDIVNVNINSMNKMTRLVLPKMLERKTGGIINVGSTSGVVPAPMLSTYSGTKAYVTFFSSALAAEYKDQGIAVQVITPGMTVSNMSKIRRASIWSFVADPAAIAKGSLDTLGVEPIWSPFWPHALQEFAVEVMGWPRAIAMILKINTGVRKKALDKEKRDAQGDTKGKGKKE